MSFEILGGGFNYFLFSPVLGEDSHLTRIFFRWVETTNQNSCLVDLSLNLGCEDAMEETMLEDEEGKVNAKCQQSNNRESHKKSRSDSCIQSRRI